MADLEATSVPPAPHIVAITQPADAKALVDTLNQNFQELVRTQRETYEAMGIKPGEWSERKAAVDNTLASASETIRDLDLKVKSLQEAARQADLAAAVGDGIDPEDPRETNVWSRGFDFWARGGPEAIPDEEKKTLTRGNAWQSIVVEAKHSAKLDPTWSPQNAVSAGGLQSTFGPGAGVWVRPTYDNAITRKLIEYSPIRSFARIVPIGSSEYVGHIRGSNRDTIEQTGEYGTSAAGTQQTQKDRYEERRIRAYTYQARPALSQEQIEDSVIDIESELTQDVALDFAVDEAENFTNGTGANEPFGYAVDSTVTGVSSRTAGALDHYDLTNLMLALRPFYRGPGAAYSFSTTAFAQAILEEDGNGRRLWQPSNQQGLPSLLNGFPYFEATEQAAVATAAKSVFFANWPIFYRIVDRRGLRVIRDDVTIPELVILNHSRRYGGRVWLAEAGKALTIT